ncbi:hypothetical protein CGRA01v4_01720 [Colletotrichum graminicola]|nr:hypothetical protein CGRA01v4_01720 [Colletotrichum graminicola]
MDSCQSPFLNPAGVSHPSPLPPGSGTVVGPAVSGSLYRGQIYPRIPWVQSRAREGVLRYQVMPVSTARSVAVYRGSHRRHQSSNRR